MPEFKEPGMPSAENVQEATPSTEGATEVSAENMERADRAARATIAYESAREFGHITADGESDEEGDRAATEVSDAYTGLSEEEIKLAHTLVQKKREELRQREAGQMGEKQ